MENKDYTIEQAIAEVQDFAKETEIFAGCPEAAKIAGYLQKLQAYEDKTPITDGFLSRRFVDTGGGWRQNFDDTKILIQRSADTYHVLIFKREYEENKAYIKTVGQLRMLLTICGLGDFVKQLKD
jgi:hypothetical protein